MKYNFFGVYDTLCTRLFCFGKIHSSKLLFLFGLGLLLGGLHDLSLANNAGGKSFKHFGDPDFNPIAIEVAVGNLFALIEGAFGALIMVVAGIGAIISAAMGAYRAAVSMIVVAVGAFILRALVSLFFGEFTLSVGTGPITELDPQ